MYSTRSERRRQRRNLRSKRPIAFKSTDQLERLVRTITTEYFSARGISLSKAELRKHKNKMLVAIETGASEIRMNKVAARAADQ